MRFSFAAAAALFGAAMAASAPQSTPAPNSTETVVLSKFKAFHQLVEGPVNEISFVLSTHREVGVAAYACSAVNRQAQLAFKPTSFNCKGGDENNIYAFQINAVDTGANTYDMTIYHQTASSSGLSGQVNIPTVCRAEGVRSEYCEKQDTININAVDTGANTYDMTIYHQTASSSGLSGQVNIPTVCRAEGVRSEYCEKQDTINVELKTSE
ncbi:hypothetical protein PpBr36_07871 [Pyricularia pennisetigena]|uniref:hypothetical protein n=1 Tax=Pyricularia pennisetigena TaxID=1578925 RepID=UPI001152E0DF|nr:hypothetical protein PpBr36_07871 [Pyricularia pennisetigena]TLS26040.1 hypothetical protein PpBr36_07871 [Pyricularia pennisetigena]